MIWKREDKENIVLRDGTGGVHRGNTTILYSETVRVEFIEVILQYCTQRRYREIIEVMIQYCTQIRYRWSFHRGNDTLLYSKTIQVEFREVFLQYCTHRRYKMSS